MAQFARTLILLLALGLLGLARPAMAAEQYVFHYWSELTVEQQKALAPVEEEWNDFPAKQQTRLLKVAKGYGKLSAEQQQRVHARLKDWSRMTPEQRLLARQNYKKLIVLPQSKQVQLKQRWVQAQPENGDQATPGETP